MLNKKLSYLLSATLISLFLQESAHAISLTYSEKTKENGFLADFRTKSNLPFNLQFNAGLSFAPSYSSLVGKTSSNPAEVSLFGSIEGNLGYNFKLIDSDMFNPTLTPYIGYKHFVTNTSGGNISLSGINVSNLFTQTGGINMGLKFSSNIPLGFYVSAEGGATRLLDGGWSESSGKNGTLQGGGTFLPYGELTASWNFFNLVNLYAGYRLMMMPDLRQTSSAINASGLSTIHSLNAGLSFLFFSI